MVVVRLGWDGDIIVQLVSRALQLPTEAMYCKYWENARHEEEEYGSHTVLALGFVAQLAPFQKYTNAPNQRELLSVHPKTTMRSILGAGR